MPTITFLPQGRAIEVETGTTILVGAIRNGVDILHDCTDGMCGTDIVHVVKGAENLSEKTEDEDITLETMDGGAGDRLCCVAQVLGDVTIEIP